MFSYVTPHKAGDAGWRYFFQGAAALPGAALPTVERFREQELAALRVGVQRCGCRMWAPSLLTCACLFVCGCVCFVWVFVFVQASLAAHGSGGAGTGSLARLRRGWVVMTARSMWLGPSAACAPAPARAAHPPVWWAAAQYALAPQPEITPPTLRCPLQGNETTRMQERMPGDRIYWYQVSSPRGLLARRRLGSSSDGVMGRAGQAHLHCPRGRMPGPRGPHPSIPDGPAPCPPVLQLWRDCPARPPDGRLAVAGRHPVPTPVHVQHNNTRH